MHCLLSQTNNDLIDFDLEIENELNPIDPNEVR
jgi:hypothetical protein